MKEHSFFLQLGFTPRDFRYTQRADAFRKEFDRLLSEAVALSNGVVSPEVLQSGEVITQYTLDAERASAYYSGVPIAMDITKAEAGLGGSKAALTQSRLEESVYLLNNQYIQLTSSLIEFKTDILNNVLSCRMFTVNYPLLIDHILREAKLYRSFIQNLQSGKPFDSGQSVAEQEMFWNTIMAEHSKFIRGLLDPTEEELFKASNNFGNEFDQLTSEAKNAMDRTVSEEQVTEDCLSATQAIRDFKAQGTQGLIQCKVKSIIIPLLGDHTLREANHYFRLLQSFRNQ
jgi:Protein of unknown function (DUF2935).